MAKGIEKKGFKIIYEPKSIVYHSHKYPIKSRLYSAYMIELHKKEVKKWNRGVNILKYRKIDLVKYLIRKKAYKELIFDFVLGAFYPHTIASLSSEANPPIIAGYIYTPAYALTTQTEDVTDDDVVVTDIAVDVTSTTSVSIGVAPLNQYLILSTASNLASTAEYWRISIGEYNNYSFTDFESLDTINSTGENYSSYLITGYNLFGSTVSKKQVPYLTVFFTQTEDGFTDDGSGNLSVDNPSSCYIRSRWDFANSVASGKWQPPATSELTTSQSGYFQAYRLKRPYFPSGDTDTYDSGNTLVVTKNSLRGSGRALSLHIVSEAGKHMKLLGWNISMQGTDTV